jgi:hypothetical protein
MIQLVCLEMSSDKLKEIHSVVLEAVKDSVDSQDLKGSMINSDKVVNNKDNSNHLEIFLKNLRNFSVDNRGQEDLKEDEEVKHSKGVKILSS